MKIAIYAIVLLLLAALIFIILSRLILKIRIYSSGLGLSVSIGRIKLFSYPPMKRKGRKKSAAKQRRERKTDIGGTINLLINMLGSIKNFMGDLTKNLVIEKFYMTVVTASENPALAAAEYGAVAAAIGAGLPFIEGNFPVKDKKINVSVDFSSVKPTMNLDLVLSVRMTHIIKASINFLANYLNVLKKSKKEKYQHSIADNR